MTTADDALGGRYRLEEPLGAGGMATVHRAYDQLLGRQVAIKILAANVAANPAHLERFGREVRAMATITHPNLVSIYDVGWADGQAGHVPFLVMELVTGGTLAQRLAAEGPLDPPAVVALVEALASALDALHRAGIVHRDVKPQNVLLADNGPKLADLGIVRVDDPSDPDAAALTASGAMPGTLRFLAPEVIFGQPAGPKADAYALAMVAYEAMTGRSPRPAMTLGELVHGAWQPVTPVSEARPELGPVFDAPFAAALDLDPNRRLDVLAFAAELWEAVTAWALSPAAAAASVSVAGAEPPPAIDAEPPTVADLEALPVAAPITPGDVAAPITPDAVAAEVTAEVTADGAAPADAGGPDADTLAGTLDPATDVAALSGVARLNPTAYRADYARAADDRPTDDRPGDDRLAAGRAVDATDHSPIDFGSRGLRALGILTLALALVVAALLILRPGLGPGGLGPGTSSPGASSSAGQSPSPSPSGAGELAEALRALDAVDAAIEGARGGRDGLKGSDANELAALAAEVGRALEAADLVAARRAADDLAERADKLGKDLDEARRDAMASAIEDLRTAIPGE